jgi:hypothetical protein
LRDLTLRKPALRRFFNAEAVFRPKNPIKSEKKGEIERGEIVIGQNLWTGARRDWYNIPYLNQKGQENEESVFCYSGPVVGLSGS